MKSNFLLMYVIALVMIIGIAALGTAVSSVTSVPVSAANQKQTFIKTSDSSDQTALPSFDRNFGISKSFQPTTIFKGFKSDSVKTEQCAIKTTRTLNYASGSPPLIFDVIDKRKHIYPSFTHPNAVKTGFRQPKFVKLE